MWAHTPWALLPHLIWPNPQFCSLYISLPGDILFEAEDNSSAACNAGCKCWELKFLGPDLFILTLPEGLPVVDWTLALMLFTTGEPFWLGCLERSIYLSGAPRYFDSPRGLRTTAVFKSKMFFRYTYTDYVFGKSKVDAVTVNIMARN